MEIKKLIAMVLMLGWGLFAFGFGAKAADLPTIKEIKDKTKNTVTLVVKYKELKNKDVKVKVEYKEKGTSKKNRTTTALELDENGLADVEVDGLKANTRYYFKIMVKKDKDSANYTDWSGREEAKTLK